MDLCKKLCTWHEGHNLQPEDSDAAVFKRLLGKKKNGEDAEDNHKDDSQMQENSLQDLRTESVPLTERKVKGALTEVCKCLMGR